MQRTADTHPDDCPHCDAFRFALAHTDAHRRAYAHGGAHPDPDPDLCPDANCHTESHRHPCPDCDPISW